mgnify:CR=1 FL=1
MWFSIDSTIGEATTIHRFGLSAENPATTYEASGLAAGAAKAIQWTKLSVNVGLKAIVHPVMEASMAYESLSVRTEDHREAVAALREKRAPVFRGS